MSKAPEELTIAVPQTRYPDLQTTIEQWAERCHIPTAITNAVLQDKIKQWGLPWFKVGAMVLNGEGKILMIHEGRVKVKKIKDESLRNEWLTKGFKPKSWVDGDGGWNLPSGSLNLGENFEDALLREVKEESGWKVAIERQYHIRYGDKPDNLYTLPVYIAKAISGPVNYHTIETRETLEIGWFTAEEIRNMAVADLLRSPDFVTESLDAFEALNSANTADTATEKDEHTFGAWLPDAICI